MPKRSSRTAGRSRCTRFRIGRVSVYLHHAGWWIYYRQHGQAVRRRIGSDRQSAERVAAEVNTQLVIAAPTMFEFRPIDIADLRAEFLTFHENVQRSSIATVRRYAAATQHLVTFVESLLRKVQAHEICANSFAAYLRSQRVAPNGHPHAARRHLRDKGVQYILETCRSMFAFAQRQRHLPPYAANPFAELRIDRMRVEDAKPIFVFDFKMELQFLDGARDWDFPIHFMLAKTGLRPGELCHLLIEDLELPTGWLHVRNKPELKWSVKTRNERTIPLHPVLIDLLQIVIGNRTAGVVFRRPHYQAANELAATADRHGLHQIFLSWLDAAEHQHQAGDERRWQTKLARQLWQAAGALDPDQIRNSFIIVAKRCGLSGATCPKSWRHSFATLLQDANVDPLLRQITMGHRPSGGNGALGMTSVYTHSRPETHAREIRRALDLNAASLACASRWIARQGLTATGN